MSRPQVTGAASRGSDGHLEGAGPDLLAGRYRLERRIAVGGMGEVWRAEDTVLGRAVAVKTLKSEYVDDPDFRERFRAEARSAARLSHPGIASVHDYGEEPGRAFLVMELVDGEPLSTILRREGALPTHRALDLVQQTAAALQAAHDGGVVHRDVKPGNLLVRPDGVVKVTDFGIASVADAVPLTRTGTVVGTAYYLSPEQASGGGVTAASDVYSLGVVAYECLAGARPFPGDSPVVVAMAHLHQPPPPLPASVPADVAALVMQALSKDPAARPADAASMAAAVAALREALPPEAPGAPGVPAPALPVDPPSAVRPPTPEMVTQALPLLAGPSRPDSADDAARTGPLSPADRPHRSVHRRTLLSALALVVVLGLGLLLRSVLTASDGTRVPEIPRGTTVSAAVAQLRDADLLPGRRTVPHPTVPRGLVLETDPPAGTARDRGSFVTLVVSGGEEPVRVDPASFLGRPLAEVSAELAALELRAVPAFDGSGTPAGTVSAMEPTGLLAPGSTVVLHVVPDAPAAPAPVPAPAAPAVPPGPVAPVAPAPAEPAVPPGQAKDRPGPPQDKPGQGRR